MCKSTNFLMTCGLCEYQNLEYSRSHGINMATWMIISVMKYMVSIPTLVYEDQQEYI